MHLKKRTKQRIFRKVASYFLTGALLFNSGDIMTGCQKYKEQKAEKTQNQGLERVPIKKSKSALAEVFDFEPNFLANENEIKINLDGKQFVVKSSSLSIMENEKKIAMFTGIPFLQPKLHKIKQGLYVFTEGIFSMDIKILNLDKKTLTQFETLVAVSANNRFLKYGNSIVGIHSKENGIYITLLPLAADPEELNVVQEVPIKEFSEEELFPPEIISASIVKNKLIIITEGMMQDKKEYSFDLTKHLD